jgi:polysaccharide export outer membrane protein
MMQTGTSELNPGDLLEVNVFNAPLLSGKIRVDDNGDITLPVGGSVRVKGMTSKQAAVAIENLLRSGQIVNDPHVNVVVESFSQQLVTVTGEVKSPGRYPIFGSSSLYDALAAAGGPTQTAGSSITVVHKASPGDTVVVPMGSKNYSEVEHRTMVEPGDTVFVSKADAFYVVGDVVRPGFFPMPDGAPMTILNALALSGGLNHTAAVSKAIIIRSGATGPVSLPVDLNQVMKNHDPNLVLQASDVLVVPRSGAKAFLDIALPALTGGAVSIGSTALITK